jgi:hypothetical protein
MNNSFRTTIRKEDSTLEYILFLRPAIEYSAVLMIYIKKRTGRALDRPRRRDQRVSVFIVTLEYNE